MKNNAKDTPKDLNALVPAPSRRGVLALLLAGASTMGYRKVGAIAAGSPGFSHGVASGDPTATSVILWSRFVPDGHSVGKTPVTVDIALDKDFQNGVISLTAFADPLRDHTIKLDVTDLAPRTPYFYRFKAGPFVSITGRTKTLPADTKAGDQMTLSLVSCSNYPQGLFHVYKEVAKSDTDLVLHLGDYIYEYGPGTYANKKALEMGRQVVPAKEITGLSDYYQRYALYRSDPDLQSVHARHPFICVWDDHEIANDSYKDGAENHQQDEGDYEARKAAAHAAWLHWLPVRETPEMRAGKIFRSFDLGGLASLIMLDTRIHGRDKQLDYREDMPMRSLPFNMAASGGPSALLSEEAIATADPATVKQIPVPFDLSTGTPKPVTDWQTLQTLDPKALPKGFAYLPDTASFASKKLNDESRTILGADQEAWLQTELTKSVEAGKPWQLLGQQLLMGKVTVPALDSGDIAWDQSKYFTKETFQFFQLLARDKMPFNLDAWDGYPNCRDRVFDMARKAGASIISFAGDTHNAWGFEMADKHGPVAIEIGTPGVSSPGLETYLPIESGILEAALKDASKELVFANSHQRGWTEVTLSQEAITVQWLFVDSVLNNTYTVEQSPVHTIKKDVDLKMLSSSL